MKPKELFEIYESNVDAKSFEKSGILNRYNELDFGFFPLGSGILGENSQTEIACLGRSRIMVLGNDFGTARYVDSNCPNGREKNSNPTIRNLIGSKGLGLNTDESFFTNLHLGLRKNGTNTKRSNILSMDYVETCYNFFLLQLDYCDPEIVLCLGKEVCHSLASMDELFAKMDIEREEIHTTQKSKFGRRRFIPIPHPSMAHFNWSLDRKEKWKRDMKVI